MKFVAEKMKQRLIAEGRGEMITEEITNIMKKLDGKEVRKNNFKALVYDEVEYEATVDGESYPVNIDDCE